jgi:pimeloyl-ACP methyl ester carboxylesterase
MNVEINDLLLLLEEQKQLLLKISSRGMATPDDGELYAKCRERISSFLKAHDINEPIRFDIFQWIARCNYEQDLLSEQGRRQYLDALIAPALKSLASLKSDDPRSMGLPCNEPTDALPSTKQTISNSQRADHRVVIALHGIRTRGTWQKQLAPLLAKRDFIPELLDYGWFNAIAFLIPALRNKKIEWFRREFERIRTRYPNVRPSLIAHSFGSYLVTRALQKYAGLIVFDQVILCGSIVRQDYDWPLVCKNRWVNRVLNDCGRLDIWAGNVQKFIGDAGPSGRLGFENFTPCVSQGFHPEWGHSDFFFELNFEERWIPFLEGREVPTVEFPTRTNTPKTLLCVITSIILLGVSTFGYYAGWLDPRPPREDNFHGSSNCRNLLH